MFSSAPEDVHDSPNKGKPRSPQSQVGTPTTSHSRSIPNQHPQTTTQRQDRFAIEPITYKEYRRAARTLAAAFDQDPFVNDILNTPLAPGDAKRAARKRELFLAFFEYSVYDAMSTPGAVLAVKDTDLERDLVANGIRSSEVNKMPFVAVACWSQLVYSGASGRFEHGAATPTAHWHPAHVRFQVAAALARCRRKVFKQKWPLLCAHRHAVLRALPRHADHPVWYLNDLGVLPHFQGHGLARRLVQHALDHYVHASNAWCYLESSNMVNRKFYQKLGFSVATTFVANEPDDEDDDDEDVVPILMDAMIMYPVDYSRSACVPTSLPEPQSVVQVN